MKIGSRKPPIPLGKLSLPGPPQEPHLPPLSPPAGAGGAARQPEVSVTKKSAVTKKGCDIYLGECALQQWGGEMVWRICL